MKLFLVFSLLCADTIAVAQPKIITQAVVSTTTNVIAPEEDELQNVQNQNQGGGGGMAMFRNFGDGETKATTYLKNDMVKTVIKTDMGRTTIIRNNTQKLTTTLLEIMGNKNGFFITDDEQVAMRKRMDSMSQARRKDSLKQQPRSEINNNVEVSYANDTKKIAGYICKKAYVITAKFLGVKDTVAVWYSPEIKLQNIASTGGLSGFGNAGTVNGFDKIDGFVMGYEMNMRRNRHMTVEVTKIDIAKEIADKEFEIPKDFVIKPMKDMQSLFGNGGGGGFQIRAGGQ
ncbi:MAG: hypothetical protein ABJA37_13160 [Ferruginibacter sp.]